MIKKEQNGTWTIDAKVKINGEWKHISRRGFLLMSEAKAELNKIEQQIIIEQENKNKPTFSKLMNGYLARRKSMINITTYEGYLYMYNKHITKYFKNKPVEEAFNFENMFSWYHTIADDSLISNARKNKIFAAMKDILKYAYNTCAIDPKTYQICDTLIIQVQDKKKNMVEKETWNATDEIKFLEAIKENKQDEIMFKLFILTGTRLGEFLALQPQCFDFDKNRVTIKQQVVGTRENGGWVLTDQLKTHESYRKIVLPQMFMDELKQYIIDNNLMANEFLFYTCSHLKPLSRNTFRRRLKYYCDKANIVVINPHEFRHRLAEKLANVSKNMNELEIASKTLGHSTSMFLNTYATHTNEEDEEILLSKVAIN